MVKINLPINRAEGDLEINLEIDDGVITEAWSCGTMFRGFEGIMQGRGALDGLVITPRICGMCSLTHLTAAVEALDNIVGVTIPDNAARLRNLALMVEIIQSDLRQAILMFMADFSQPRNYPDHPLFAAAKERFTPLTGTSARAAIRETKRLIEIIAIIGGQWPHTSFMVPGGVTHQPEQHELVQCRLLCNKFRSWYEKELLGCCLERWHEVDSSTALDKWLAEKAEHRNSVIGFFIDFCRQAGLDRIGCGPERFLSFGGLHLPQETAIEGINGMLTASGFAEKGETTTLKSDKITEECSHAWYRSQGFEMQHPYEGETIPYASGASGAAYSWVKAPRYDGRVVETGPLAEAVIGGDPLISNLLHTDKANVMLRELARLLRPARLLPALGIWIDELLDNPNREFYHPIGDFPDGQGAGLIEAARGALGHWVHIENQKITHYQIITPTTWNGSPRDHRQQRGAWEEALVGTPIRDSSNPFEAGLVIRSFDPCLVCAVHTWRPGGKKCAHFHLGL